MSEAAVSPDLATGRQLSAAGIDTHLHEAGEGEAVLFLHGSGPGVSAWANWRLVLPQLSRRFRVLAHDQAGYNKSGAPAGNTGYGRQLWTDHALGVVDALGLEKVHLVGNSMGGAIALSMAVARPEQIGRIVVMGTMGLGGPIPPGLDELWGYRPSREAMHRAIQLLAFDQSINTPELVELRYQASVDPRVDACWEAMFPAPRQRSLDDLSLGEEELRSIRQPVLMVHGYNDAVIPFADTTLRLMDVLADARMHVFGQTGHWVQIERNHEFSAVIETFLAGEA